MLTVVASDVAGRLLLIYSELGDDLGLSGILLFDTLSMVCGSVSNAGAKRKAAARASEFDASAAGRLGCHPATLVSWCEG